VSSLSTEDIDKLGEAIIALTKEVWVLRDRQRVLEAALSEAGVLEAGALDAFQPDEALQAQLAGERTELVDTVLSALTARK